MSTLGRSSRTFLLKSLGVGGLDSRLNKIKDEEVLENDEELEADKIEIDNCKYTNKLEAINRAVIYISSMSMLIHRIR